MKWKLIELRRKLQKRQEGQAFILVLIMLLVGGLLIAPLLTFMGTGVTTGQMYEDKTTELYAADSGIEDGIWQIKYDDLESLSSPKAYSVYDYSTVWDFELDEAVNSENVSGTISNIWVPKGFSQPSESQAQAVIEGIGGAPPKTIITGGITGTDSYQIKITYNKEQEDEFLYDSQYIIEGIGIWLPTGFEYVAGSSNLEENPIDPYYSVPTVTDHAGGQAVVWSFSSLPIAEFPGVQPSDSPMVTQITFDYTAIRPNRTPEAVSWVECNMNLGGGLDFAWDGDTKVFQITSEAGDTELEAYSVKSELRELGGSIAGDYHAFGNTLLSYSGSPSYRNRLYEESSASVTAEDTGDEAAIDAAYLYWSGWIDWHGYEPSSGGGSYQLFFDDCTNLDNGNWDYESDWRESSSYTAFYVHNDGQEVLTLDDSLALGGEDAVTISWRNWTYANYQESSDCFQYAFYNAGGWSSWYTTYCGNFGTSAQEYSTLIPAAYLTDQFLVRFRVQGFSDYNEYCYLDNVTVSVSDAIYIESCTNFNSWNNGADWSVNNETYRGHHIGATSDRYLTMSDSVDLSGYSSQVVAVSWEQWEEGYLESYDRLYFAFSDDGGVSWGDNIEAFRNDIGSSPEEFSYDIPASYLTDDFRMRFYLDNFGGSGEYCYIDNIVIAEGSVGLKYPDTPTDQNIRLMVEETARVNTVMFNDVQIFADDYQVLPTFDLPGENTYEGTWSYNCFYDATDMVEQWIDDESLEANGTGSYTVGHVVASNQEDLDYSYDFFLGDSTGYPLGTPAHEVGGSYPSRHNYCYSGWSLILIYSSPEEEAHQLYLYDIRNPKFTFAEAWYSDPDFDGDGADGGLISGFLAPESIIDDDEDDPAISITVFAGEGDSGIQGDYISVNGENLSNAASPSGNIWNSASPGLSIPGVDIDTFQVHYPTIVPQDTHAEVHMPTNSDGFLIVYIILSFRSDVITGDTISYLIRE